jgi:hypothetical protein
VSAEDAARAHRLLMEAASELPQHDVYFVTADDTTALEPSRELVERFRPDLSPLAGAMTGHQSFLNSGKLKGAVGWEHPLSWRQLRE